MFQNAREIFNIFGFKIRIDPSWFFVAALIVWSLSTSYFPQELPQASQISLIFISVIAMIGLFVSLIIHELAHSLVARKFGLHVGNITLFIFGGVAELERDPDSARSEFWIAIAGPVMSYVLGIMFLVITLGVDPSGSRLEVSAILEYLAIINFVLATFNLIPAFPLDGGRVLRAILWFVKGDVLSATRTACNVGSIFAILLACAGMWLLFSSQFVAGIWQILIGLVILGASKSAYDDMEMRYALKDYTVSSLMTRDPWVADVEDTIQHLVDKVMLKRNVSFVPVLDRDRLLGHVDAAMIQTIDQDNWEDTRVGDIFIALDDDIVTRAETRTEDVFDQMVSTGNRKLMIVNNDRLEGVIALSDLLTFLSIRSGLGLVRDTKDRFKEQSVAHV
ncbi:MAG: site-2 protease family protein [Pseudomonadota bacterium]